MHNLREKFSDPNSTLVLDTLAGYTEKYSQHPLIRQMQSGDLSIAEFAQYTKARLDAANVFVPFLSSVEDRTRQEVGWGDVTDALRENLDEEMGVVQGVYWPEACHEEWRRLYRTGINRVLQERGINLDTMSKNRNEYGLHMNNWTYQDDKFPIPFPRRVPGKVGGFSLLEALLEKEFKAQHAYIHQHFPSGLNRSEMMYIAHHAGHEQSHATQITEPLLVQCQRSPHIIPDVLYGIQHMFHLRYDEFLTGLQQRRWW